MASAVIGALRVNLGIDSAEFQDGLKKANAGLDKFAAAAKLAGVAIATAFAAGIGKAVGRVEKMEAATRRLDQALANAGNAAKTSGKDVADWASQLERRTGRAAQEVMAVGANLASFNFGEEIFFRAIELGDDMAAAWGGDLRSNLEGLSRALDDPANGFAMLRKRGIALTDAQEALVDSLIASNDKLGAQKVVLEALEAQVKGVAEAGFQGLTKSMSNLGVAIEGFFDKIVQSTGFGTMIAGAIDQVTRAVDFLTAHLGTVAEYAAFVGGTMAIAFGPQILLAVLNLTAAVGTGLVGAFVALRAVILANPLVAFATAIGVALAAVYHFRDEIKNAIGVDVVNIVKQTGNTIIGIFLWVFEDIRLVFTNLPQIVGGAIIGTINVVIAGVNQMISHTKAQINNLIALLNNLPYVDISPLDTSSATVPELRNEPARQLERSIAQRNKAISGIFSTDYIGNIASTFQTGTSEVKSFTAALGDANAELDAMGGDGGGGGGKGGSGGKSKLEKVKDNFKGAAREMERMVDAVAGAFSSAFQGLLDGSKSLKEVMKDLLSQLSSMLLNDAFKALVGGFFGGGGGGLFAGIGKLFGFARGGTIMPGGSGGIDSQLVAFRKSPNERVDITKPGQTLSGGRQQVEIVGTFVDDNGVIKAQVQTMGQQAAQAGAAGGMKAVQASFPSMLANAQSRSL